MKVAFSLVAWLLLTSACSGEASHGGFGEVPPTTIAASPSPIRSAPAPQRVTVSATPALRFDPQSLEIEADRVTEFELRNADTREHTFVISELAVAMLAASGQTVGSTVPIDPKNTGQFPFFCSIHRAAGMEGTIVVT